jgi:hypothetical protein
MTQKSDKLRLSLQPPLAPNRLPDDLRRSDAPEVLSEEIPPPGSDGDELVPAGGGFTPTEDGGNKDHPMHDADPEDDATPGDYEWEIRRLDAASRGS